MMKRVQLLLGLSLLLLGLSASAVLADASEFRLVVSSNAGATGGRFAVDLEIRGSASRTLNSLTADVFFGSELAAVAPPGENWFTGSGDYETSVTSISLPGTYYRVLVTGNNIGKTSAGVPAGFTVTTSWQRVVTLVWSIATLSNSYNVNMLTYTDCAAYFDNAANNPLADLTEWDSGTVPFATVKLAARAFLQGPYNTANHNMNTDLYTAALLPPASVYTYDPRTVAVVPASVDWVMLQLRSSVTGPPVFSKSLFLRSDGQVVDEDGTENFDIPTLEGEKSYYVVLSHRNHLATMSSVPILLTGGAYTSYDFTTAQNKAYGTNPMKAMADGAYAFKAGDGNGDGGIDAGDYAAWFLNNGTAWTYAKWSDFNLDGGIDAIDANSCWRPNNGSATQVP